MQVKVIIGVLNVMQVVLPSVTDKFLMALDPSGWTTSIVVALSPDSLTVLLTINLEEGT